MLEFLPEEGVAILVILFIFSVVFINSEILSSSLLLWNTIFDKSSIDLNFFQDKEMTAMSLGLAHSLSRYKLKFSPDKIDTMIVQAVSLLDDLDKELNNYIMRTREW